MERKLFFLYILGILLLTSTSFAEERNETECDYALNGDSECDDLYCIENVCTRYDGATEEYCTDSDGNSKYAKGTVSYLYRDSNGNFIQETKDDSCYSRGDVSDCGAGSEDCEVLEYLCVASGELPYSSVNYACEDGCEMGKCLDNTNPTSQIITGGVYDSSNYPEFITGTAYDSGIGLEKVELKIKRSSDSFYWSGSSWIPAEFWVQASGLESWEYTLSLNSLSDGNYIINSRATDLAGNIQTVLGENEIIIVQSEEEEEEQPPVVDEEQEEPPPVVEDDEDEEQPPVVDEEETQESISDEELLAYIEQWANGELGETEEENDEKIQEIIEIWKNS